MNSVKTHFTVQMSKLLVELSPSLSKLTYLLIYIMLNTGPNIPLYIVLYSVVFCKWRADLGLLLRNPFLPASSTFLLNTILFNALYNIVYTVLYKNLNTVLYTLLYTVLYTVLLILPYKGHFS